MAAIDKYNQDRWGLGIDDDDSESLKTIAVTVYNRKLIPYQLKRLPVSNHIYDEVVVPAFREFLSITGIGDIGLEPDLKNVYDRFAGVNEFLPKFSEMGWKRFLTTAP